MPADHCVVYGGCSSIKRPKQLDPSLSSELQSLMLNLPMGFEMIIGRLLVSTLCDVTTELCLAASRG